MLQWEKYEQGDLDGLCGIYASLNGLCWLLRRANVPFSKDDAGEAFYKICKNLEPKLADAVGEGITSRRLGSHVLEVIVCVALEKKFPLKRKRYNSCDPNTFWDDLSRDVGGDNRSAVGIIRIGKGIDREEDHWTCAWRVTGETIFLIDSGARKMLRRSKCVVGQAEPGFHRLYPAESWLLSTSH
jgi:hypothetical protein